MTSLEFNTVLLEISNDLLPEQLEKMKFLCDFIGKNIKETIDTGFKLFKVLVERNKLTADDTTFLCSLLTRVQRPDLSNKLSNKDSLPVAGLPDDEPDEPDRAKLDIATEVIAENLGKIWRKLGRKLGLTEVKLESIYNKHPTDLEETARELLKDWRKGQRGKAQAEQLIKALRACDQNLTADKVEDKLQAN
ncbi:FAS-associated death domain protein [Polymixia lowei]